MPKKDTKIHRIGERETAGKYKISVYKRKVGANYCYYGRFKIDKPALANGQRYITKSLKTDDLSIATDRANEFYVKLEIKQESDVGLKEITVALALDKYIKNYEKNLKAGVANYSPHMLRGFKKSIDIFWREYIGKHQLNSITFTDIEGYELWRRSWAKNPTIKKLHGNYKAQLANRTIVWEINAFKQFLRWCFVQNLYSGQAYSWQAGKHLLKRQRRSAFTREQYTTLYEYMRTNKFLEKGLHNNDRRILRHRKMLRAYILFMINIGLRIGEARHLRWGDLEERKNKKDESVILATIQAKYAKNREERTAVGRPTALKALNRWKEFLNETNEKWNKDTYIFCNDKGEVIQHFREGFNAVIKEAGVEFDRKGKKLTPYSLRHSYITFRLVKAEDMSVFALAKNCGTSVQMIEQFYSDAITEDFIDELTL